MLYLIYNIGCLGSIILGIILTNFNTSNLIFFISGMWCSTCARSVEKTTSDLPGVQNAKINYATKLLQIIPCKTTNNENLISDVENAVKGLGFYSKYQKSGWVTDFEGSIDKESSSKFSSLTLGIVWFFTMWTGMFSFSKYLGTEHEMTSVVSYLIAVTGTIAIILGVIPYTKSGLRALIFSKLITIDLIIFLGALSALSLSFYSLIIGEHDTYFDSASMIIAVLLLSKKIEDIIFNSITKSILFQISPQNNNINVFRNDQWKITETSKIRVGEKIHILKNETIPFDGEVLSEFSLTNNHLITGENADISTPFGNKVYAGAISKNAFEMKVIKPLGGRMIDQWAESALLENSSENKFLDILKSAEKKLATFSLFSATLLFAKSFYNNENIISCFESFFVGILIFCPCLFASILPLAKQFAFIFLRKNKIGTSRIEALFDLNMLSKVCIDKTGTLEAVQSELVLIEELDDKYLNYIYSIIKRSSHPILKGISDINGTVELSKDVKLEEIPGKGVVGITRDGDRITIGKDELVIGQKNTTKEDYPSIYLNELKVGYIILVKHFRKKADVFLSQLEILFPKNPIQILSGDPDKTADKRFSNFVNINYFGNLSPNDKTKFLDKSTLFIGDGLNDTLALSKAGVGIRLGNQVTSITTVDFQIPSRDLSKIIFIINYSKRFKRIIVQTVLCAATYNVIAIILALNGLFNPLGAVCAMLFSFMLLLFSVFRLSWSSPKELRNIYEINRSH